MKNNSNLPNKKQAKQFAFKKYFFKTLHIITYILSFLFIIVCIVAGVHGCSQSKSVSAESPSRNDSMYLYSFLYENDSTLTLSSSKHNSIISSLGLTTGFIEDDLSIKTFHFYSSSNYLTSDLNASYYEKDKFSEISFVVAPRLNVTANDFQYKLVSVQFDLGDSFGYIIEESNVSPLNHDYQTGYYNSFIASGDLNIEPITLLFNAKKLDNFAFDSQFNYNAPYRINRSIGFSTLLDTDVWNKYSSFVSLKGSFSGQIYSPIPAVNNIFFHVINVGDFISNGRVFNNIFYMYIETEGFIFDTNLVAPANSKSYWALAYYYGNAITDTYTYNDLTFVNYRNWSANAENLFGTAQYELLSNSSWTNDNYRYITFIEDLTYEEKDFFIAFNSNQFGNTGFNDDTIYYGDGGVLDVFTLLGNAFAELQTFLNIKVLPSISIGTLLFLPLVVGIVMTIFWLVKR